jgi:hypothetical protein
MLHFRKQTDRLSGKRQQLLMLDLMQAIVKNMNSWRFNNQNRTISPILSVLIGACIKVRLQPCAGAYSA